MNGKLNLPHECQWMTEAVEDDRVPVIYVPRFREFGFRAPEHPTFHVFSYCPGCGQALPGSLRDEFFDRIETMGLEPESPDLPLDFRSDAWWRLRSLG